MNRSRLTAFLVAAVIGAAPTGARAERVLRLARYSDPKTLDPARVTMAKDLLLLVLLHQPLLDMTGGTTVTNLAARSWESSADGRRFTFKLRPELKFSNGRAVVAADYAYAIERMLDPRTQCLFGDYFNGIRGATDFIRGHTNQPGPGGTDVSRRVREPAHVAGIQTPNPETLVIELEQPDPTIPLVLANVPGMVVPREEVERKNCDFNTRPVGNGPYVVKEWLRGVRLIFGPNPYYAGREPRHFDRIEVFIGADFSTLIMMFERGETDVATIDSPVLPLADHYRLTRDPRWRLCIERTSSPEIGYVALNNRTPPLNNAKVRQALNYAVNKPRCINSVDGRSQPASGLIPPCMPAYNPKLVGYPYDPLRAKSLLEESGLPQPIKLSLWHTSHPDDRQVAQAIQADLGAIGIAVELKTVSGTEMNDALSSRGDFHMAFGGWACGMLDPKEAIAWQFDGRTIAKKEHWNFSRYNNAEVNQMLDRASVTLDPATRDAMYRKIEQVIVRDAPVIFLSFGYSFAVRQPWLKGQLLDPVWRLRLDRVWIER